MPGNDQCKAVTLTSSAGEEASEDMPTPRETDPKNVEDRKARKRRMDAEYSRKRRAREKRSEIDLQATCADLGQENRRLQKEGNRLVELLAEAKAKVAAVEEANLIGRLYSSPSGAGMRSSHPLLAQQRSQRDADSVLRMSGASSSLVEGLLKEILSKR